MVLQIALHYRLMRISPMIDIGVPNMSENMPYLGFVFHDSLRKCPQNRPFLRVWKICPLIVPLGKIRLESIPLNPLQRPGNRGYFYYLVYPIRAPERQPECEYEGHFSGGSKIGFWAVDLCKTGTPFLRFQQMIYLESLQGSDYFFVIPFSGLRGNGVHRFGKYYFKWLFPKNNRFNRNSFLLFSGLWRVGFFATLFWSWQGRKAAGRPLLPDNEITSENRV
jgi:hypothetical protein